VSYSTTAQLASWLEVDEGDLTVGDRVLARASELIDEVVVAPYDPDDEDVIEALADATCAQVEFWLEAGEEHDIGGQRGDIAVEGLRIGRLPNTLAPRARRALALQNLLTRSIQPA
jgi:hypothetical protein